MAYSPPPPVRPSETPSLFSQIVEHKCTICDERMLFDNNDCYLLSTCEHIFHRGCIEQSLSSSADCPTCKVACQLSDLRNYNTRTSVSNGNVSQTGTIKKTGTFVRGKSRGAMGNRPQTRSSSKNLFNPNENGDSIVDLSPRQNTQPIEVGDPFSPTHNSHPRMSPKIIHGYPKRGTSRPPQNNSVAVDYDRINAMIGNSLSRILQGLNVQNGSAQILAQPQPGIRGNLPPLSDPAPPRSSSHVNSNHPNGNGNISFNHSDSALGLHPDKISTMIRNWNIRFDGSKNGLTVDEFLYRITSMTREHLNGNFEIICSNLQTLLYDKALHWYWRYHKQVNSIRWDDFCVALKCEFKDMRSNYDIREELRNRKMRPSESFESFYDSICVILDRLETPMVEAELVEILVRNLRPDIRHELLYVPVYSIAHLRKLVQMRENLLADDFYKRTMVAKHPQTSHYTARRQVAEVSCENPSEDESVTTGHVDAVQPNVIPGKCWNCEEPGHFWDDCVRDRTVFCYGCGTKNVYKPQCAKCLDRKSSGSKNYQRPNISTKLP